jgi:3-hydroxyphenylacetate 6-hydroxylase
VYIRMLNSFEIIEDSKVDTHPVKGSADPTSLVTMCKPYTVKFRPRNVQALRAALEI